MRKTRQSYLAVTGLMVLGACDSGDVASPAADSIYVNGDIVTVDANNSVARAVAVKDGRILAVGDKDAVLLHNGADTRVIDLGGRAMLPGFIDSHSHLSLVATKLGTVDLSPKPAGVVESIADIERLLHEQLQRSSPQENDWVIGWGYDHSMLAEQRHPTRDDLDRISDRYDIILVHFSGHQAVLNSSALERIGYNADTADPVGGVIRRRTGSREPNGIIEEAAWIPVWQQLLDLSFEQKTELAAKAVQLYVSAGFTTVQDGGIVDPDVENIYAKLAERDQLPVDVIGYPYQPLFDQFAETFDEHREYQDRFRFGGIKIVLDGGSPGRTAYLREPYFVQLEGDEEYRGYPHIPDQAAINELVGHYFKLGIPVNIHALGDAAIDQAIEAISKAEDSSVEMDRRSNLIHLQFLQEDQLDALRELDVTLTFQVAHNYYFGDLHREWTVGPERAARLNPAASARDRGLSFTIHHDAPIHPVDQLMLIWTTVNRVTRSGYVLGEEQRISVMDAIRASTINAAWQYFEEQDKGSIEVGKLADFVVLSANPLTIDPMGIRDLQVVETIKGGLTIYRASQARID